MNIKKGSYADKILVAIAFSGEFAYKSLYMLDEHLVMLQRNARKMRDEGYISITGKGRIKTLRMKQKGRETLSKLRPELYNYYLFASENNTVRSGKGNEADMWRKHRMAETLLIIQRAGSYFLGAHKPNINVQNINEAVILPPKRGFFYSSREIKSADIGLKHKVSFTRVNGLLSSSGGHYGVYNTNEGVIKWNYQGENKARKMMEDIVNTAFYHDYHYKINSAIMFAKDMMVAKQILETRKVKKDARGFELLSFDNTYPNIHFLPLDSYGIDSIRMLTTSDWKNIILENTFPKKELVGKSISFEADAYNGNTKTAKIEFFSGDVGKLQRVLLAASFNKDISFEIHCFRFQEQLLKAYLPKWFTIVTYEEKQIFALFK